MSFGLSSITGVASDAWNKVSGDASSALQGAQSLGSSALSHASDLGRQGLDLGRKAVDAASHVDVKSLGDSALRGIGKAETAAENGIRSGVMTAGKGVGQAADWAKGHIQGNGLAARVARGAIDEASTTARFDIGVVGGVAKGAVGLVGSAGQLGVLGAEYQLSPSAHAAIDAKVAGAVEGAGRGVADYASSVAQDPGRVVGDVSHVASSAYGWGKGQVTSAEQAIAEGHGPESFGLKVGDAATYLVPIGGEARAAAGVGEVVTRGLAESLTRTSAEGLTRGVAADGVRTVGEAASGGGGRALAASSAEDVARKSIPAAAPPAAASALAPGAAKASDYGVAFFGKSNVGYYTVDNATLGRSGSAFFMMPLEDSAAVTDAASAARETGMSPSTLDAYKNGGDIYGLSFPTDGMAVRQPVAADAKGWPHFLEGGHTAVKTGDGPTAGYLINNTREFVIPGGTAVPKGSVLFKLDEGGAWTPVKRF